MRPSKIGGKPKPTKSAEVVLQIVQDALDSGQQTFDLKSLLKALKSDPAKVFGVVIAPSQQVQQLQEGSQIPFVNNPGDVLQGERDVPSLTDNSLDFPT
jgi:hypothetical protein